MKDKGVIDFWNRVCWRMTSWTAAGEGSPLLVSSTTKAPPRNDLAENGQDMKRMNSPDTTAILEGQLQEHRTTDLETILHLLKGYLGAGLLSLPYAVSQLGIFWGVTSIFALAYWTSINCYTVVLIKLHIAKTARAPPVFVKGIKCDDGNNIRSNKDNDAASETSSNITYPDVGNWAYGAYFENYVRVMVVTLQMAVCTVYVSFIGENLLALFQYLGVSWVSHSAVMTIAMPFILILSYIPDLKRLAPVMAAATTLLIVSLTALGIIVAREWRHRPDETPSLQVPKIPASLCMILYSYEGINIILPVHAAMKTPSHFDFVFWFSMGVVALCLASVAVVCVMAFGNITNGSVTAFLLQSYHDDNKATLKAWIIFVNSVVSISVLLTYPLTIYPAIEILASLLATMGQEQRRTNDIENEEDDLLEAFEPLPVLPERGLMDMCEFEEHTHEGERDTDPLDVRLSDKEHGEDSTSAISSFDPMTSANNLNFGFNMPGDSILLRTSLVLFSYAVAVSIPNVQTLISLVGALAGSSAALLVPPLLEIAFVEHLEAVDKVSGLRTPLPPSPYIMRKLKNKEKRNNTWVGGQYWKTKIKCYVSFALGVVFLVTGTTLSVLDIINIYTINS